MGEPTTVLAVTRQQQKTKSVVTWKRHSKIYSRLHMEFLSAILPS
jgi:hypothetical protein